ncbi:MAG: 7-carboxy-7-deazaguanine synthase [Planctomycetia bacterium]|nr:7-carboxy-7-deazaguanine synthase [Planctomycetia bacterium]
MTYSVKELFYTLQGEGAQAGRGAVFCRFAGCNLWSGREEDRSTAVCNFCDTDFVGADGEGGGQFADEQTLADAILGCWTRNVAAPPTEATSCGATVRPFVVFTGGEPLLQLDETLVRAVAARGFEIAIETNGTRPAPPGIDWICVSPKAGADLVLTAGDELKLVFPQEGAAPEEFSHLKFGHFFLQPMDGPDLARNTRLAVEYCLRHPPWRLSLQTHKLLGLP